MSPGNKLKKFDTSNISRGKAKNKEKGRVRVYGKALECSKEITEPEGKYKLMKMTYL